MAGLNVDFINPFLMSAVKIIKDVCQVDVAVGKPSLRDMSFGQDTLVILIGVTGEMKGQAILAFANEVACDVAGRMMMGPPLAEMDEIGRSAICELGNMIMGNTATIFATKGIGIDITPPTMCSGNMTFSSAFAKDLCVPLCYADDKVIEFHIAMRG